jgi:hypothetical protein
LASLTSAPIAVVDLGARSSAEGGSLRQAGPTTFSASPIRPWLALLSWRGGRRPGVPDLAQLLDDSGRFAHLLVDLGGLERSGDQPAAIDLLDGIAIVARAGVTRDNDLLRLARLLPVALNLGVVLVGPGTSREARAR